MSPLRSERSTRLYRDGRHTTCMNLHPVRFTLRPIVTVRAGELLPHLFTLTPNCGAVCFLWHFLYSSHCEEPFLLGSTVPVGVRTFLPVTNNEAITRILCSLKITNCLMKRSSGIESKLKLLFRLRKKDRVDDDSATMLVNNHLIFPSNFHLCLRWK